MSEGILIIGHSGTGKTTSIRNLDPKSTFIIKVKNKKLPFRGSNRLYTECSDNNPEGNVAVVKNPGVTKRYDEIALWLNSISERRPEIKTVIIDDFSYLMIDEYMATIHEKGFEKFALMGARCSTFLGDIGKYRKDLVIFVMTHSQENEDGLMTFKTIGKMVDKQYVPVGCVTMVLHSMYYEGKYQFLTQTRNINDRLCNAKSPMDMFESDFIDNDLQYVIDTMNEYENFDEDINM
jgi:signal recognition particle receptor subunit beta